VPLRSVEAATRDDAIAAAREQYGPTARVVGVRRVRSGGVLGFFATERYVAEVAPDPGARPLVPLPASGRPGSPAPAASPLASAAPATARSTAPARNGAAAYAAAAGSSSAPSSSQSPRGAREEPVARTGGALRSSAPADPAPHAATSDDEERLSELVGLLAAGSETPAPAYNRAAFPRATVVRSAREAAPTHLDDQDEDIDDDGDDDDAESGTPSAAPSPFTAALARMVSGDRDVRQAVEEALEQPAAASARTDVGPRPTWSEPVRAAEPPVPSPQARQKEETVGDQVIAPPSMPAARPVEVPAWAPSDTAGASSREAAIAEVLRSALAQGHSDEALAGILRKVVAGASPQTALTEPHVAVPAPGLADLMRHMPSGLGVESVVEPVTEPVTDGAADLARESAVDTVVDLPAVALPPLEPRAAEVPAVALPAVEVPAIEVTLVEAPPVEVSWAEMPPVQPSVELPPERQPRMELPPVEPAPVQQPRMELPHVDLFGAPMSAAAPAPSWSGTASHSDLWGAPTTAAGSRNVDTPIWAAAPPREPAASNHARSLFGTLPEAPVEVAVPEVIAAEVDAPDPAHHDVVVPEVVVPEVVVPEVVAEVEEPPAPEAVAEEPTAEEPATAESIAAEPVGADEHDADLSRPMLELAPLLARTASDPAPMSLDATTVMPPLSLLPPLPGTRGRGRPPVPPGAPRLPSARSATAAAAEPIVASSPVPSAPAEVEPPAAPSSTSVALATVTRLHVAPLPTPELPGVVETPELDERAEVLERSGMDAPVETAAVTSTTAAAKELSRAAAADAIAFAVPAVPVAAAAEASSPVVGPAARQAPAEPGDVVSRLESLGVPADLLGSTFADELAAHGTYAALTRALGLRLPPSPELPLGAGEVLFVVGPGVETLRAARSLAATLRLDPERVHWATRGDLAGLAPETSRMATIDAAIDRRQAAATAGTVTIVAVDAPMRTDAYWMAQMLAIWSPVAVWAVVEATRKPEDLEAWLESLSRVDALIVQDTDLSADPAAVLRRVAAPVALLDGVRATPHRWASLLCERLEGPQS
jgi:hypothetical protein